MEIVLAGAGLNFFAVVVVGVVGVTDLGGEDVNPPGTRLVLRLGRIPEPTLSSSDSLFGSKGEGSALLNFPVVGITILFLFGFPTVLVGDTLSSGAFSGTTANPTPALSDRVLVCLERVFTAGRRGFSSFSSINAPGIFGEGSDSVVLPPPSEVGDTGSDAKGALLIREERRGVGTTAGFALEILRGFMTS